MGSWAGAETAVPGEKYEYAVMDYQNQGIGLDFNVKLAENHRANLENRFLAKCIKKSLHLNQIKEKENMISGSIKDAQKTALDLRCKRVIYGQINSDNINTEITTQLYDEVLKKNLCKDKREVLNNEL
ncbi:MAG: hypothetical protein ABIA63_07235, partial [bacterium]